MLLNLGGVKEAIERESALLGLCEGEILGVMIAELLYDYDEIGRARIIGIANEGLWTLMRTEPVSPRPSGLRLTGVEEG